MEKRDLMDVFSGLDLVPRGDSWEDDVDRILLASPGIMQRMGAISVEADVIFALVKIPSSTFAIRPIVAEGGICEDLLPMLASVLDSMDADGYVIVMRVPKDQIWSFYSGMERVRKLWVFDGNGESFRRIKLNTEEGCYQSLFNLAGVEARKVAPESLN